MTELANIFSSAHADENDLKYSMKEEKISQTEAAEEYKLKQEVEDLLKKVVVLEKQ